MLLVLYIKSYKNKPPSIPIITTFDQRGGRIGRSLDNDWVLPDPQYYISKHHAIIEFNDGEFLLKDISANGVFINESSEPLGNSNSVVLKKGDRLFIGEYEIYVSFDSVLDIQSIIEQSVLFRTDPFGAVLEREIDSSPAWNKESDDRTIIRPRKVIPEDWMQLPSETAESPEPGSLDQNTSFPSGESAKKSENPEWYAAFRHEIERLPIGTIMFNPPSTMRVGVKDRVEVRISTDNKENLLIRLKGRGEPKLEQIKVSEFMKVSLSGNAFVINKLNEEEQIVASPDFTEWAWDLVPIKSGQQTLHLLVTARIMLPFGEEKKDHPVIDRNIEVSVNPVYSIRLFLLKYRKWIITAILLPFLVWAWKTYTKIP